MIYFMHNCQTIFNPLGTSEAPVDPVIYGFEVSETGGGAKALIKVLEDGSSVWLTDETGMNLPDPTSQSNLIGYRDVHGNELACHTLPSETDIHEFTSRAYQDDGKLVSPIVVGYAFFTERNGFTVEDYFNIAKLNIGEVKVFGGRFVYRVPAPGEVPRYCAEFQDYDDALPSFWPLADVSWHNNIMPSFAWADPKDRDLGECCVRLWCDYKEKSNRECPDGINRFLLSLWNRSSCEFLFDILGAETIPELREACNEWYLKHVGYRPDDDGNPRPIGELIMEVGQMAYLHGREPQGESPAPVPAQATLRDLIATLPHFCGQTFAPEILALEQKSGCGEDCVKALKLGEQLASQCADIEDVIVEAVIKQVRIFYFG